MPEGNMKHDLRFSFFGAVTLALVSANAYAGSYGDTAYYYNFLSSGCNDMIALSLPLSVSVSSRIYVNARTSYSQNGTGPSFGSTWVELHDSSNTIVAASQWAFGGTAAAANGDAFLESNGVLHDGTNHNDVSSAAFVAAPGSYTLKMHVQGVIGSGTCSGTLNFTQPTLTYILLSSAFDRIFANGFQAMLGNGGEQAMIV
jgi:hypothetical protein